MSEETKTTNAVMSDTSTVKKKIETIVFGVLKNKIRGHIYVKMEEKENEKDVDTLYIGIDANRVKYTDRLRLPGDTFKMVTENDSYAETLALMIFDNYKKYIDTIFFIEEGPKRFNDKFKKNR